MHKNIYTEDLKERACADRSKDARQNNLINALLRIAVSLPLDPCLAKNTAWVSRI